MRDARRARCEMHFDEISTKFRVFGEISSFRFCCLGLFSKCRSCTWHMPGFGKAARRPNGDVGCSPAGPSDGHGGWPGIGQWGMGRRCHPGGGMRPRKRHGMQCAPVQKAPVHGFGDGPAPHPSTQAHACAHRRQDASNGLLNSAKHKPPRRHWPEWPGLARAHVSQYNFLKNRRR